MKNNLDCRQPSLAFSLAPAGPNGGARTLVWRGVSPLSADQLLAAARRGADPSGATERAELHCADLKVIPGINAMQLGIAAVTARLANGCLRIVEGACPNLIAEAGLYRYPENGVGGSENPMDEHNHALAALRYLISRLDERRMARHRAARNLLDPPEEEHRAETQKLAESNLRKRQREHLWTHPGACTVLG